jgi:fructose-specific phosphotransferase system component IIB
VAKRKVEGEVNKSQEIRAILAQNPKTPAKTIVDQLAAKNIKVAANLVYLIKSKEFKRARRARRAEAVEANRKAGIANPVEIIRDIRRCAEKAGGMKHLRELVELLAQ